MSLLACAALAECDFISRTRSEVALICLPRGLAISPSDASTLATLPAIARVKTATRMVRAIECARPDPVRQCVVRDWERAVGADLVIADVAPRPGGRCYNWLDADREW